VSTHCMVCLCPKPNHYAECGVPRMRGIDWVGDHDDNCEHWFGRPCTCSYRMRQYYKAVLQRIADWPATGLGSELELVKRFAQGALAAKGPTEWPTSDAPIGEVK
jgi:hypothetical protein